jgi:Mg2+ and Co2+ transporter CorA
MENMNQQQLLEAILEKTSHVRNGIKDRDMDIVENALDEREALIAQYSVSGFGVPPHGECSRIVTQIMELNTENNRVLKSLMDECNEKVFEARREIKKLKTGKQATHQYHGAVGAGRGGVFDFKK